MSPPPTHESEYAPLVVLTGLDDILTVAPDGLFTVRTTDEGTVGVGDTVPVRVIVPDPE
jgi:hypothetical protein